MTALKLRFGVPKQKDSRWTITYHYITLMDLDEIRARVKAESDARFGETIEKMLLILRYGHTHQCWRKECWCEYCQFINGTYVAHKLQLHQMKKKLNWYDMLIHLMQVETQCARKSPLGRARFP